MGLTAASGGYQAYTQYQQGVATNNYYQYLAEQSRIEGETALRVGKKQSELIQEAAKFEGVKQAKQSAQISSAQRAALAANGIDLSSVTAEDITADTFSKSKLDELAIRYNADVRSWSVTEDAKYKNWAAGVQSTQQEFAGKQALKSGKTSAFGTIIGTAASIASMGSGLFASKGTTLGPGTTSQGIKVPTRYIPPR